MLTNGTGWPPPRSRHKKSRYPCRSQSDAWDSELFLDEYPRWRADSPQHPCILQRMFTYAEEAGQKEQEWVTHWGCWQPVSRQPPRQNAGCPDGGVRNHKEEIQGYTMRYINKKVYWAPTIWVREDGCPWLGNLCFCGRADTAEVGYHQARRRSMGATAPILQPSCQTEFHHWTWRRNETHMNRPSVKPGGIPKGTRCHPLFRTEYWKIEFDSWQGKIYWMLVPLQLQHFRGRTQGRCAWSPSSHNPRKHVTFQDQEEETSSGESPSSEPWGQVTGGREVEENDLGPPPTLGPELECFLEMPMTVWGARDRQSSPPEQSINNYEMWLEWQAHQLDTPDWREKLTTIPNTGDPRKLTQKICASFKIPEVRCETPGNHKEYTAPPAHRCVKQSMFLPNNMPYQDIHLKSPQNTLVYAQALQYWAEGQSSSA